MSVLSAVTISGFLTIFSMVLVYVLRVPILIIPGTTISVPAANCTYPGRSASFGPSFIGTLSGYLDAVSDFGCGDGVRVDGKFVLVKRGECSFVSKVRILQERGAKCVIVGDSMTGGLITMYGDDNDISIPSMFISKDNYLQALGMIVDTQGPLEVAIYAGEQHEIPVFRTVLMILASPALSIGCAYLVILARIRRQKKLERAPVEVVERLPRRRFKGGQLECVICLEDCVADEWVIQLPCGHEYHAECITPWLVKRRRVCPICKRDVSVDERTPLIV